MQPTFLPWVGYFALMNKVDEFVLLDHVQFDKRSWQQRNQIKTPNGPAWLAVPVYSKGKRGQAINEVVINEESGAKEKLIKSIEHNYKKSEFFHDYFEGIRNRIEQSNSNLCSLNVSLITFLKDALGIETPSLTSSQLGVAGQKADLLTDICLTRNADTYLSPPGAADYIDASDSFKNAGIEVIYFAYTPVPYRQLYGSFEGYMSVIDLLFNEGPKSREIMLEGCRDA